MARFEEEFLCERFRRILVGVVTSVLFGRSSFSFATADARVITCDVEADFVSGGRM